MRTQDVYFKDRVKEKIIYEVISKTIHFYRNDPNKDNRSLIELLLDVRKCTSVFELLKQEKEDILREELEFRRHKTRQPLLIWTVNNITNYFYKQSDSISLCGAVWRIALSYFKKQETCLKVELKIMNNPYDVKTAKDYFKKNEFELPANLDQAERTVIGEYISIQGPRRRDIFQRDLRKFTKGSQAAGG